MKMFRKIFAVLLIFFANKSVFGQTGAMAVFDPTNWLTSVENLYASYDMVTNAITRIEQNYKMIQHQIEAAQSIDWNNIKWDGDFDIRNELNAATTRVNRLLSSINNVKDIINKPNITVGSTKMSIADICDPSYPYPGQFTGLEMAALSTWGFFSNNMKQSVLNLSEGASDDVKRAVVRKYGISMRNYVMAKQTSDWINHEMSEQIARADEEFKRQRTELKFNKFNVLQENLPKDENGNYTAAGMSEAQLRMIEEVIDSLESMHDSFVDSTKMACMRLACEKQEQELEKIEKANSQKQDQAQNNAVDPNFISEE